MLPDKLAGKITSNQLKIKPKQHGELRILSADIALMSSKKNNNDATAIFVNQMMPTKAGRYVNNIIYSDAMEGVHTADQALEIRKLYDQFGCDYIVLDCQGAGIGLFDSLARDIVDPDTGEIYPALSCCNDPTMAERCTVKGADKVIWSIKANANMNSECAILLREGFRSGKVRLLMTEYDAEQLLGGLKGYSSLDPEEKVALQMPYIHTTLLVDELVKLKHDESSGKVKLYERSGMRKDRYSSLSYNIYVSTILESRMGRKTTKEEDKIQFVYRAPGSKDSFTKSRKGRW